MGFFDQLTKNRYNYKNTYSSFKFIDFMNTDMPGAMVSTWDEKKENTIKQIIREVFSYRRYEPGNPYVFHKVVPSARNIHPNEAFLIENGQISRFNSKTNLFESIGINKDYLGKLWIVIASELWRIMKFYGEFGLALSLLDAGHIQAHLKLKLISAGYDKACLLEVEDKKKLIKNLGFSENSTYIGSIIDLSEYVSLQGSDVLITMDSQMSNQHERKFNYENEVSSYPRVLSFLQHKDKCGVRPIAYSEAAKSLCGVLDYELARNSGHSMSGLFSTLDRLPTDTVMQYAMGTATYIKHYLGDRTGFFAYLLYRALDGEDNLILVSEAGIERRSKLGKVHRKSLLHDTFEHINMHSIPLNVFIIYAMNPTYTQEVNIQHAHIGAGEIIQYISLLVARDELFARPMKNFNDANIAKVLNINSDKECVMYSTIIGRENCFNYVVKL